MFAICVPWWGNSRASFPQGNEQSCFKQRRIAIHKEAARISRFNNISPRGKPREPLIRGTEIMRMAKGKTSKTIRMFAIALICNLYLLVFLPLTSAQDTENADAHFRRAKKRFEEGSLEAAEREYRLALKLAPGAAQGYNNLGVLYFSKKDFKQAVTAFKWAQSLRPKDPEINFNLGLALFQTGNCNEA